MKKKIACIAAAAAVVLLLIFGGRQFYLMGYESGIDEGHFGWYDKGYSEGSEDGYERGFAEGVSSANAALSTAYGQQNPLEHGENGSEHGESNIEHDESDIEHDTNASEHADEHGEESQSGADEHECDFVLNKSSKKFHKPDCSSVAKMKEANREYYSGSRDALIAKGYKPCGGCNP